MLLRNFMGLAVLAVMLFLSAVPAGAQDTIARQAILVDFNTGAVLLEKNADQRMPPSSMSKIMTAYMLFEKLKRGDVRMTDEFTVSERAWRMGGSKMFVMVGTRVKVEDLIRGIIIQSGNDACVVVAENLAGTEEAFAEQMNRRARELGLKDSNFRNATGWPDPDHYMTARDLAILAKRLITDFPEYYHFYKELNFTYNGIRQGNRNPLLYQNIGADGLKTGHTEEAGYGLTASVVRGDRRLILVVNGLRSMNERGQETGRLMDYGFREFENYALFKKGDNIDKAPVWLGAEASVPLVMERDVVMTMPRRARPQMKVVAQFEGPVPAPVAKGDPIGKLVISAPGVTALEVPLVAGGSVDRLGLFGRVGAALRHLVWGSNA
ncbi:MAG: D-alanyl-D-alanine carboxypeptidase family protein [Alphaproteobacteria bacterium]